MTSPESAYPLERSPAELRRLRVQADSLALEASILLDRIGVGEGWQCLDLGCGVGGIVDLMSRRVGRKGRIVGLDPNPDNLGAARQWATDKGLENVTFVHGDAFANDLPSESFDLVHMRYVMTTIGRHAELVEAALRLVRPGACLAVQEGEASGLACYPPHPAWDRLKALLVEAFARAGADCFAGRHAYRLLVEAGLRDVAFRPCQTGARSTDPLADYLPETIASTKPAILRYGLMPEAELDRTIAECRRHLAQPTTIHTSVIVMQVWGRKPTG